MIDKQGYLSKDIVQYENQAQEKFSELFDYYRSVNEFGQDLIFQLKIQRAHLHHWSLAALMIRALSTFQSIYILLKKGIISEAKVLHRTLIEIKYIIVAIEKNNDLAKDYLGQEEVELKRIFRNSQKWPNEIPEGIKMEEIAAKIKELNQQIKNHKIKKFTTKAWATKANMLGNYETYYSLLCLASHANSADVKNHFVFDDNGIISTFKWGPDFNNTPDTILSTIQTALIIIESIGNSFSIDILSNLKEKVEEFKNVKRQHGHNKKT